MKTTWTIKHQRYMNQHAWSQMRCARSMVFNQGQFSPSRDIWQYLKTFLVVAVGEGDATGWRCHLAGRGQDITKHPSYIGQTPQQNDPAPMSRVLRLRNPMPRERSRFQRLQAVEFHLHDILGKAKPYRKKMQPWFPEAGWGEGVDFQRAQGKLAGMEMFS